MTGDTLAREHFANHGDVRLLERERGEPFEFEFEAVGCTMRVPFSELGLNKHYVWLLHREASQRLVDAVEIHAPEGDPLRDWIREEIEPAVEENR